MRRRLLFVPLIAASLIAPPLAAAGGSSPLASKHAVLTSTSVKTGKALPIAQPAGRRWN